MEKSTGQFEFGQNWADFSRLIDQESIDQAITKLSDLLGGREAIKGRSFLDIGCGSGLHALAAQRLGASEITAIDYDPHSVSTAQKVFSEYGMFDNAEFLQANILTLTEEDLKAYDIVYSWGVLHHTGNLWRAVENASRHVKPNGIFAIALYEKTRLCPLWKIEKKVYSSSPVFIRRLLEWCYMSVFYLAMKFRGKCFQQYVDTYNKERGMNWRTDVRDWLGGWPYESASQQEVETFVSQLGFERLPLGKPSPPSKWGLLGTGCSEYVFRRIASDID
ncbi:class I SAM-dependent methyltransferase [Rubinisphaera italica]|uniref:Ubiquinone biosynthesis O-methyltransferase n=1 Tax=Rubinisphaera italica TaxID=2527969 RepID=A0A5C5XGV8_9PLAN|nr:class I SAM-dependent methyltransferase [Rubinisphaera italica]TWT61102.1 Ubiquinone biosynthesis O-methyltransferase [Rubinisphaera italica]